MSNNSSSSQSTFFPYVPSDVYPPTSLAVSLPNSPDAALSIQAHWIGGRSGEDFCTEVTAQLVIDPARASLAHLCEPAYVALDVHARDEAMKNFLGLSENLTHQLPLTHEMGRGFLESLYNAIEQKFPNKTFGDTIQSYLGIDTSDFHRIVVAALSRHVDKPRNIPERRVEVPEVAVAITGKALSLA